MCFVHHTFETKIFPASPQQRRRAALLKGRNLTVVGWLVVDIGVLPSTSDIYHDCRALRRTHHMEVDGTLRS